MDLRSISGNQVTIWVVLAIGLFLALVIGSAVGNADVRFVVGTMALIPAVFIFLKLKTNIWVLLPISYYLTGRLNWLPLPLSVREICFLVVILCFVIFIATRTVAWKRKASMLDYLIYINLAYLVTVYVRNPAGFWFMQTAIVGGRVYFEVILFVCAYIILSRVQITDFITRIFPLLFVAPAWAVGLIDVFGRISPQTGYIFNSFYSGVGPSGAVNAVEAETEVGTTRLVGLMNAGSSTMLALCAKYNPITLISPIYPWRVVMLTITLGAIFLAGFRSVLLSAIVTFLLSSILRGKIRELWLTVGAGVLLLALIIAVQGSALQLPLTMQRALSWLPGDWDQEAVESAEMSTQWRIDMWEWAWNDERLMRDKVWGSGFGFSLDDMNLIMSSLALGGTGSSLLGGSDRESFMITGTLHSGPLSTIKYIGAIGLSLYFPTMCYMALLAWRLCKKAKGTRAFTLCLFVGIPIMYDPFNFVFIFGALELNYLKTLFYAGLLNMAASYVTTCTKSEEARELLRKAVK
jgi:hypothetical protein